jgi:hypothetical protein
MSFEERIRSTLDAAGRHIEPTSYTDYSLCTDRRVCRRVRGFGAVFPYGRGPRCLLPSCWWWG